MQNTQNLKKYKISSSQENKYENIIRIENNIPVLPFPAEVSSINKDSACEKGITISNTANDLKEILQEKNIYDNTKGNIKNRMNEDENNENLSLHSQSYELNAKDYTISIGQELENNQPNPNLNNSK